MGGLWGAACEQCACVRVCVYVYMSVCVPAHTHCALEGVGLFVFVFFNITAENRSVGVAAPLSCQASHSVGFGVISGHKFISPVGVWG